MTNDKIKIDFKLGQYELDENEIIWEWTFAPYTDDLLEAKIDELLKKHCILFNCPNIWRLKDDDKEEEDIIVHCCLSLAFKKDFKLAVKIPKKEYDERYVVNGQTSGIPASQFFCSIVSTVYYHDNIEKFKELMDEKALELVKRIRGLLKNNMNKPLLEEAIEIMKPSLEKFKKNIEEALDP